MKLKAENLQFSYRDKTVLKNFSFEAVSGQMTIVLGANGAGKSTLLRGLSGVTDCAGTITLEDGTILTGKSERRRLTAYLIQESDSGTTLSVLEMVLLGRLQRLPLRVPQEEIDKVMSVLNGLGISTLADRRCCDLSGGQRRIVAIAQTLVKEPRIMLFDEPTTNLDIENELEVLELIRTVTRERNIVTVVTMHDLNMAGRFADKIMLMKDGRLLSSGAPVEVITVSAIRCAYNLDALVSLTANGFPMVYPLASLNRKEHFTSARRPSRELMLQTAGCCGLR